MKTGKTSPATHLVITGNGHEPRAEALRLYAEYLRTAVRESRLGTTLWLTPTARSRRLVVRDLLPLAGGAVAQVGVHTFESFAEAILHACGEPVTAISPLVRHLLVKHAIDEQAGRQTLDYFRTAAEMPGFVDVVTRFITELKRDEIWPEEFLEQCESRPGGATPKDRELAAIYTRYQEELNQHHWYDVEGRFWLARRELEKGLVAPFQHVELVVVEGFSRLTAIQYDILATFAQEGTRIVACLPDDGSFADVAVGQGSRDDRGGLFAASRATQRGLLSIFRKGNQQVSNTFLKAGGDAGQGSGRAGLVQVRDQLFVSPREISPVNDSSGVEVIAAAGAEREREAVSRQVKLWLREGIAAEEIVIGVRSSEQEGPLWVEHLTAAGIPAWTDSTPRLSRRPIVRAALDVLALEASGWDLSSLQGVLDSSFIGGRLFPGGEVRRTLDELAHLQVRGGRQAILRRLRERAALAVEADRRVNADTDANVVSAGAPAHETNEAARKAWEIVSRLDRVLDAFRQRHPFAGWITILSTVVRELGFLEPGRVSPKEEDSDRRDWDLLQRTLRNTSEAMAQWQGEGSETVSYSIEEAAGLIDGLLRRERSYVAEPERGRVRVLDVQQVRVLEPTCLVLVGAVEQAYPGRSGDDCLYSDAERREMTGELRLRHQEDHLQDEMLLFWTLVTRPREQLLITYPAVNSRGHEVFASPYVSALVGLFTPEASPLRHAGSLDPLPAIETLHTRRQLRLLAMQQARDGRPGWLRQEFDQPKTVSGARNSMAGLRMLHARFREPGFTSFDGRIENASSLASLEKQFGPREQFSVTRLESYAECPFRFWLTDVLGVRPSSGDELSTDYRRRGNVLHRVAAVMLSEGLLLSGKGTEVATRFRELLSAELGAKLADPVQESLLEIEAETLEEWAEQFSERHDEFQEKVNPLLGGTAGALEPETAFGQVFDDHGQPMQGKYPQLVLGTEGHEVRLGGRIDRIDYALRPDGSTAFTVIDYKTGGAGYHRFTEPDIWLGQSLQLTIYLMAIRRLGMLPADASPCQMGYWGLKKDGFKPGLSAGRSATIPSLTEEIVARIEQACETAVQRIVRGLRSGEFFVDGARKDLQPPCTTGCDFRMVCRVKQQVAISVPLGKRRPEYVELERMKAAGENLPPEKADA